MFLVTRVIPMSVLEFAEFQEMASKLLTQEEILEVVTEIAKDPQAGDVVPGCGGIRKLRFKASGHGKRGGGRVIYVYYCEELPVFILTCYPKNVKDNLTAADKKALKRIVPTLRREYEAGLAARIENAVRTKGEGSENETKSAQGGP
jgi:hypothetical protein